MKPPAPSSRMLCLAWCFAATINVIAFVIGGRWLFAAVALVCMFMSGRRARDMEAGV